MVKLEPFLPSRENSLIIDNVKLVLISCLQKKEEKTHTIGIMNLVTIAGSVKLHQRKDPEFALQQNKTIRGRAEREAFEHVWLRKAPKIKEVF